MCKDILKCPKWLLNRRACYGLKSEKVVYTTHHLRGILDAPWPWFPSPWNCNNKIHLKSFITHIHITIFVCPGSMQISTSLYQHRYITLYLSAIKVCHLYLSKMIFMTITWSDICHPHPPFNQVFLCFDFEPGV